MFRLKLDVKDESWNVRDAFSICTVSVCSVCVSRKEEQHSDSLSDIDCQTTLKCFESFESFKCE
ncbi:hypothetical protein WN48_04174 [Eufriesea mexicana]|nr:hypothetical protein WN48_04174 [Eufriesea mexicana]